MMWSPKKLFFMLITCEDKCDDAGIGEFRRFQRITFPLAVDLV